MPTTSATSAVIRLCSVDGEANEPFSVALRSDLETGSTEHNG